MWWRPFGRLSKCDICFPKCGFEIIGGMRSEYFCRGELCSPVFCATFFRANAVRPYGRRHLPLKGRALSCRHGTVTGEMP